MVGCSGDLVAPDCLPVAAPGQPAAQDGEDAVLIRVGTTLDDAEQALLRRTLASVGNNKTRAAEILGITPKTLRSKLGRSDVPREVWIAVGQRLWNPRARFSARVAPKPNLRTLPFLYAARTSPWP